MRGRRALMITSAVVAVAALGVAPALAGDRPFNTSQLVVRPMLDPVAGAAKGQTSGGFSKRQIERFRCYVEDGVPTDAVDISCDEKEYGQDWAPDNELAVAVNPDNPNHIVAGSNDYFYRFNNSTGARQAIVPTGFFTSTDGGESWVDGQIPMQSGNGAGDPSPAFDSANGVVLMAQLENTAGLGGPNVSQGNVSVSRSYDGGITWEKPVVVFKGNGAGIGPANQARFYDKEWLTVDNNEGSPFYGRAYLTTTLFQNGLQGSYVDSPIFLSYSDDGGVTWTDPQEISGSNPKYCTYQETGPPGECDEDQFSIPEVATDGTLYVHFLNGQNDGAWEVDQDFDNQIMVTRSIDGGETFSSPVPVVQLEDGLSDMPYSVIFRQTVWGHQIRWTSAGNITVDPTNPEHVTVVWSDRGLPNDNATPGCFFTLPGDPPDYDPCDAGPESETDVWYSESIDGGASWSGRRLLHDGGGAHQWFPWADYKSDGTLVAAWDQDDQVPGNDAIPANDTFHHVYWAGFLKPDPEPLGAAEHIDESVTHWAGQYVPQSAWPTVCGGPDPGKQCNVFHGDYTGLQVGPDDSVHIVWTGLNRTASSPQIDPYTGQPVTAYAQDAMYARR